MNNQPAILGNRPLFENKVFIVKPSLPSPQEMQSGMEEIIISGMVTKGKYLKAFEEAVAEHLQVNGKRVATVVFTINVTFKTEKESAPAVAPPKRIAQNQPTMP